MLKMEDKNIFIKLCSSKVRSFIWRLPLAKCSTFIIKHHEYIVYREVRKTI